VRQGACLRLCPSHRPWLRREHKRNEGRESLILPSLKAKRDDGRRYEALRGNRVIVDQLKSRGFELMICVTHPRIHLLPLGRVTTHCVHWRGEPRAHLLDGVIRFPPVRRCGVGLLESLLDCFGFFGDAADSDNGVRTGGGLAALHFPLPIGVLVARPGKSSSSPPQDAVPSVLRISTLTRFERRTGDVSGPNPDSGSLSGKLWWFSS